MTLRIVDVSRHQVERPNPLSLAAAKAAGFAVANIQLDRGRQEDVLPAWAPTYASRARDLGMDVSSYRWLDGRLTGKDSAQRAFLRMRSLGGPHNMVHTVDTEETSDKGPPATERIIREYVLEITYLLGRPIALYTGDWWWTSPERQWLMSDIAPYLWAAPNAGYQADYPGDESRHWDAGYGGWPVLTVMQYAVKPIPGTGNCSLSAVRDVTAWTVLKGGNMRARNMQRLTTDVQSSPEFGLNVTVWGKGDLAHQGSSSDHNEDDTAGSKPEQTDADNIPEHRAIDIPFLGSFNLTKARILRQRLTDRPSNQRRLKYVILEQNIWRKRNGWKREDYTGDYHNHLHVSGDVADDENGAGWDIGPDAPTVPIQRPIDKKEEDDVMVITYLYCNGKWGLGVVSGGKKLWIEANSQARGDAYSDGSKLSAKTVTQTDYDAEKAQFIGLPA